MALSALPVRYKATALLLSGNPKISPRYPQYKNTTYFFTTPKVPDTIKEAVNNGTLAVFIGAGVSRLVGSEGWDILAKNLIKRCHEEGIINFKEHETISQISDHRKTITICSHLFGNKNNSDVFYEEMDKSLNSNKSEVPNIYDEIYKLRGLFITTNADTHFDRLFIEPNILYEPSDFKKEELDRMNLSPVLYHIHGSIKHRESLIFTLPEYIKRYTNPKFIAFREFLERIFHEYTVLFLGYGLAEFEILNLILKESSSREHFMLSPFYRGEENMMNYEQLYYNSFNIKILGYEKDINGYKQLIEVIKQWNKEINEVTEYLHNAYRLIDNAVE